MTANSAELFDRGLDTFGGVVRSLDDADWDRDSPCDGWTARDVLGHLGTSVQMGTSVLQGQEPSWPDVDRPADLVQGSPVDHWDALATEAQAAMDGADLDLEMDTPMGRKTVADRLAFPAIDLYVHAWDLARAAGRGDDIEVPDDVIALAHQQIDPLPEEAVRGPKGSFGPEVVVADGTPTEQFLGWTGRDPRA